MKSDKANRKQLIAFLENGGGQTLGLTVDKFHERGEIVDDPSVPGKIVFKVVRHRAIGGARYASGLPMSAFEEYLATYHFDPENSSVQCVEESIVKSVFPKEYSSFANRSLDDHQISVQRLPGRKKQFRVELQGLIDAFDVASFEEATKKMSERIQNLNFASDLIDLEDKPGIDIEVERQKLRVAWVNEAISRLEQAWKKPLSDPD